MYNSKFPRYIAYVYFMAFKAKKNPFSTEDGRIVLKQSLADYDQLAEYIVENKEPSKFLTSSQVNVNYVCQKTENDTHNFVEPVIVDLLKRSNIIFEDNCAEPYISFKAINDLQLYLLWKSLKGINAFLYDGKRSLVQRLISELEQKEILEKSAKMNKISHKQDFVYGITSIATSQYEMFHDNEIVSVFNDKEYINIQDLTSGLDDTCPFKIELVDINEATAKILNKFLQNSIVHHSLKFGFVKIESIQKEIYSFLDRVLTKIQRNSDEVLV